MTSPIGDKRDVHKKVSLPSHLDWYFEQGFALIPLPPTATTKDKDIPSIKWKDREERLTREEILERCKTTKRWAICCGEISNNLVVIDVDKEDLFSGLNLGEVASNTYVEERKGKFHIYLRTSKPIKNKKLTLPGEDGEEISIRFNDKLIISGYTEHPSGGMYQHFPTSPKEIKTVDVGFFGALEKIWEDKRELTDEGKKGFGGLKKGINLKGNILDVIKSCVEEELKELKDNGETYTCRCPFPKHKDLTPSFTIYKKANSYYCFGCNRGGNVINFVKDFYGISAKDAIKKLKDGGVIEEEEKTKELSIEEVESLEDYEANHLISNTVVYHKLHNDEPEDFYAKVYCNEGEIKKKLVPFSSVPLGTAPSTDFYEKGYRSLKELFDELKGIHQDYVAFATDSIYPTLTALGSMVSYFREAFYTYPYFDFISGEPESGKTTAMKTQVFTSFYGTVASSVSEALLFREIDSSHCFYGLDNIERLFARPKDYAGIIDWLLSSYSRDIPCRRLAKVGDNFEVVSFDGYGEKAFTHITDFPVSLSTLKSRCIQIVMQKGKPTKFYPTPGKFAGIRDKLYHARLREYQKVKDTYEALIISNVLIGRTGDLYYPLLSIAKLMSEDVYKEILSYAKETERERTEVDEWNRELINFLCDEGQYGSISPKDIRLEYQDRLREAGLLKEEKVIYTRTVTNKLKKLGFKRDKKTTDNKTWFIIDQNTVLQRAHEYGIPNPPPEPNLSNLPNSNGKQKTSNEENTEEENNKEIRSGEKEPDETEEEKKLSKLGKLANTGVLDKEKPTPKEIKKIILEVGKCNACGKEEIDLIYVVFYSNGEFKYVCEECGDQIMNDYDLKLIGGDKQ